MTDEVHRRAAELRDERAQAATLREQKAQHAADKFANLFDEIQADLQKMTSAKVMVNDGWFLGFSRDNHSHRIVALELVHIELADIGDDNGEPRVRVHTKSRLQLSDEGEFSISGARKYCISTILEELSQNVANGSEILEPEDGLSKFTKQQAEDAVERKRIARKVDWGSFWWQQLRWAAGFAALWLVGRLVLVPLIKHFFER